MNSWRHGTEGGGSPEKPAPHRRRQPCPIDPTAPGHSLTLRMGGSVPSSSEPEQLWGLARPPRTNLAFFLQSLDRWAPGTRPRGCCGPHGLPGSYTRAGFKDASCSLHPLTTGTGRRGAGGPHPQVQPSEPPAGKRDPGHRCADTQLGSSMRWQQGPQAPRLVGCDGVLTCAAGAADSRSGRGCR